MEALRFESVFADKLEAFISYKRALGIKYETESWIMREFDRMCEKSNITNPLLTKEVAETFLAKRGSERAKSRYNRVCVMRQFAAYLNKGGERAYIWPEEKKPFCRYEYAPYIFCESELDEIFGAAKKLHYARFVQYAEEVLPTVFQILYRCGLRTSEVRNLKRKDVNLEKGTLAILNSKNCKDRLVPMSEQLAGQLSVYMERISILCPDSEWLFPRDNGAQLGKFTIYVWFRNLLEHTSIPHYGRGKGPRVHDLRHTFAVHSMSQMEKSGMDLYTALPILSAYMGHGSIFDTERYLRMTAHIHTEILDKVNKVYGGIVPPVAKVGIE